MADTTPPVVATATTNVAGTVVNLGFTEAGSPPVLPASGGFGFSLGGTAATVVSVSISGTTGVLTLSGKILSTDTPVLNYSAGNITDSAGSPNSLATITAMSITNNSTATSAFSEVQQATGALAQIIYLPEATWGVVNPVNPAVWTPVRVIGGESLDQNVTVYKSREIRSDRTGNQDVLGTQDPVGSLPFELAPGGVMQYFWHCLGGTVVTTGSGPYTHVMKGSVNLPTGFSLEKGFTDLTGGEAGYFLFLGNRVDSITLNCNVDQIANGTINVVSREVKDTTTSASAAANNSVAAASTNDPFTSTQIQILESTSYNPLGLATQLTLNINNQLYRKKGFVLGSDKRANLKAGTRMVTGSLKYLFSTVALYNKAINATSTALRLIFQSGIYYVQIDLPNVRFTPNNSMPKIADDGPIEADVTFNATKDATAGYDIKITAVLPTASLIV